MAGIPIGPGYGAIEGRIARIERTFVGMSKTRIKAEDDGGNPRIYEVFSTTATPSGEAANPPPFTLTASVVNKVPKYKVSKGSVTDGTNGTAFDLGNIFDKENTASAGFVVLSAKVAEDFTVSNWKLAIVETAEETQEVKVNDAAPPIQSEIRLLIGKITLEKNTPKVWQAQFSSVRLIYGVLNGMLVKVLESAPTHIDQL